MTSVVRSRPAARGSRARVAAPVEVKPGDRRGLVSRLACGGLAVAMAAGLYLALTAPAFGVARIEVTGERLLAEGEIVTAASALGQNVFTLDRRRIASAVAALEAVREVDVAVTLPGTVRIGVVEFEPRYLWQAGSEAYFVDERGVVLAPARGQSSLPAVSEPGGIARKRGDKLALGALQAASRLVAVWPARLGKAPVCEFGPQGLTLVGDKWRAEVGDGSGLEAKVLALASVLDQTKVTGRAPSFIDLRNAERPYYK